MYLVAVLSEAALDVCFHPRCGNTAVYQDLVRAGGEQGMPREAGKGSQVASRMCPTGYSIN